MKKRKERIKLLKEIIDKLDAMTPNMHEVWISDFKTWLHVKIIKLRKEEK